MSPVHAQRLRSGGKIPGAGRKLSVSGGRWWPLSRVAILVSLPDRPALRPRASLGGQGVGLKPSPPSPITPNPLRTGLPRTPAPL